MMGFISIKTGRDVVFFNQGGLRDLPLVYMLVAMVSVMGAMIHLQAIKRWGARRVRSGVFLSMALLFFCFVPFVDLHHKTAMLALFALVPAAFAALFATAWLLAGDLLEEADEDVVRWAYTRIGAGSMIGGIAGGVLAGGLSLILAPRFLVAVGAVILLVAAGIVSQAHRKHPIPGRELRPSPSTDSESGWQKQRSRLAPGQIPAVLGLMKQRYILGLIGISGLGALAALYIDFQFYAVATLTGHADAQFFASFYTVLNLAALALQLLATPWIQSRYGVGGALLVLPMALLGGAGAIMLSTTVLSRAILRVTEGG